MAGSVALITKHAMLLRLLLQAVDTCTSASIDATGNDFLSYGDMDGEDQFRIALQSRGRLGLEPVSGISVIEPGVQLRGCLSG